MVRLTLLLAAGAPLASTFGCNAKVATVLASDQASAEDAGAKLEAGTPGDASDGSAPDTSCTAKGGVCLPGGESAPPNRRKAAPGEASCAAGDCWLLVVEPKPTGPACSMDAECNEDLSMSALLGHCYHGICVCKQGSHVQPSGKCNATPPSDCASHGGTCVQNPASCPPGDLAASITTNQSCGDFIEAVCCIAGDACTGPTNEAESEMHCCAPNDAATPPICVNGWKTCPPGYLATQAGCG